MVADAAPPASDRRPTAGRRPHLLIVEARFYDEIADLLLAGATRALEAADATFDRVTVPGALEIPAAIRLALDGADYDAFVALGCVIRGETSHYDIVAGESARGLIELARAAGRADRQRHPDHRQRCPGARARRPRRQGQGRRCGARRAGAAAAQAVLSAMTRRRAARFGAIQALYQAELTGRQIEAVIAEFQAHRLADLLEPLEGNGPAPEVDRRGSRPSPAAPGGRRPELDPMIEATLAEGWSLERAGYLLRAFLRAGAFELAARPDVPVRVVINEYVELAHDFLSKDEAGFINAVLDRLAGQLRPDAATWADAAIRLSGRPWPTASSSSSPRRLRPLATADAARSGSPTTPRCSTRRRASSSS